jgi:DNA-binding transcriptional MerR regulator
MFTVGQLAKHTGVSIRTLHYYEKLGLLQPKRTDSQYRVYGEEDIIRLQQIAVLKKMRFTLSEIGGMLGQINVTPAEGGADIWRKALEQQLVIVHQQQENLRDVELLLHSAQYAIKASGEVNLPELMDFIRQLEQAPDTPKRQSYFSKEELAVLPVNDFDNPLVMEWAGFLNEIQQLLQEPPSSPASQQLAARIAEYGKQLFQGNDQLMDKYWSFITPQPDQPALMYGMTAEVMSYIEQILDVYDPTPHS